MTDEIIDEPGRSVDAAHYLPYFLTTLSSAFSWGASKVFRAEFGVGLNEWRMLSSLRNEPGIRAQRVCEMVSMNKSLVSRSARSLEERGMLTERLVDGQRRMWLTPAGAEMHDRIMKVALEREAAMLTGFSQAETDQLFRFMARLHENLALVDKLDVDYTNR
ncbi:MarR family winged helix-turn-helix transcriptional regulator [Mesobacterium pallidum]|uniref:MarR family winged helix-turn-helix transcriptional regulator n=1 Tax=Mesobacterium pallidum TaxID=2872037 RepID=UPI001EE18F2B|nr:MarR family winged helix-turn-helix transcriptional regulator [Mesobacterium pallidum]